MLGLIFIYFVGKYYYELARDHNRNKWLYAIGGIASYYAGSLLGGVLIGIGLGLFHTDPEGINETLYGLFALPFGLAACYGLYRYLKNKWGKPEKFKSDILDDI